MPPGQMSERTPRPTVARVQRPHALVPLGHWPSPIVPALAGDPTSLTTIADSKPTISRLLATQPEYPAFLAVALLGFMLSFGLASVSEAATPSVKQALGLTPTQSGVNYDTPGDEDLEQCTINVEKGEGTSGWVVKDQNGQLLRRFTDSDGDNVVDHWCYFKDGIEVYRDVDTDSDGKADQFRWLGPAGVRWGQDSNGDTKLDSWKAISAEEVTAEVVAALADRDPKRFQRLLLKEDELKSLGLGEERTSRIKEQLSELEGKFQELVSKDPGLDEKARWVRFDAVYPGVLPAGTDGSTKDVWVYDHAAAVVETGDQKFRMVQIGTLIRVDDRWRVVELPQAVDGGVTEVAGTVFRSPFDAAPEPGLAEDFQKLLSELEGLDRALADAKIEEQKYHARRAELLQSLYAKSSTPEDRAQWGRQFADTVSVAAQSGALEDGTKRLEAFVKSVKRDSRQQELHSYAQFRFIMADYAAKLQQPEPDFAKIQETYIQRLEEFVEDFPESPDTAEALLQLGVTQELAGQEDEAKKWYEAVGERFPKANSARKAQGAFNRLDSVGKPLRVAGRTVSGRMYDTARLRGKIVLIDYWATWCGPCKEAFDDLKKLQTKYGRNFTIVGINLDNTREDAASYLRQNPLPWESLFAEGGLESTLATQLGILTLPTKILLDSKGKVVNRNVHISELEKEIQQLLKSSR